jgi:hypothetical protein
MGIHTVAVNFRHDLRPELGYYHNPKKKYHYLTDLDDLKVGDTVVVDSPTTGYTCVVVVEVMLHSQSPSATKWVIDVVDDTHHKNRVERMKRKAEIERQLKQAVRRHRELIDYETVAKWSTEAASLLEELKRLES